MPISRTARYDCGRRGDLKVFIDAYNHPIATLFVGLSVLLLLVIQVVLWLRRSKSGFKVASVPATPSEAEGDLAIR